jgi:hypothetical protein
LTPDLDHDFFTHPDPGSRILNTVSDNFVEKVEIFFTNIAVLRIRTPEPDPDFLPILEPGVKKHQILDPGSWIRNTVSDNFLENFLKIIFIFSYYFFPCYR